jgi:hypothetical protein
MRLVTVLFVSFACVACNEPLAIQPSSRWTQFVQVEGQPDPVPAEWVSTPAGRFAHSIKLPNPLPKDSGYRKGMKSEEYFAHLCKTEAGDFIYKTVDNVRGFYFARPPRSPTDDDLRDRYALEAPEIERTFQLMRPTPQERAEIFFSPPWNLYSFIEEPSAINASGQPYLQMSGLKHDVSPMKVVTVPDRKSEYGLIWRGVKRPSDRENAIAGSEWIIFDLRTKEVLAVQRNYGRTGFTRNAQGGIWWLNALSCPDMHPEDNLSNRFYLFATKSLRPSDGAKK